MSDIDPELRQERISSIEERRFSSTRFQISSVLDLGENVNSILEVGPGNGFFASLTRSLGYNIKTADIKSRTNPDYLGDFRNIDIPEKFDLVAAFEMLQHLPYEEFPSILKKFASLSNRYILISVPARTHYLGFSIDIPRMLAPRRLGLGRLSGTHSLSISSEHPRANDPSETEWEGRQDYWNPHYWEVGRKSYPKSRLLNDIQESGLRIIWADHNPNFRYHLFVLAEKLNNS
jgi:hypothetical protein